MHRFKQPDTNKHGRISFKNAGNCETTIDDNIAGAKPIWTILNMSEEEYYARFHQNIVSLDVVEVGVEVATPVVVEPSVDIE